MTKVWLYSVASLFSLGVLLAARHLAGWAGAAQARHTRRWRTRITIQVNGTLIPGDQPQELRRRRAPAGRSERGLQHRLEVPDVPVQVAGHDHVGARRQHDDMPAAAGRRIVVASQQASASRLR